MLSIIYYLDMYVIYNLLFGYVKLKTLPASSQLHASYSDINRESAKLSAPSFGKYVNNAIMYVTVTKRQLGPVHALEN